jgi:hypothetical protein
MALMPPPTITERFPPLPLDRVIALIEQFPAAGAVARLETIEALVTAHAILCYDWGQDWRYHRARTVKPGTVLEHVHELIWRSDVAPTIGRANPAGFPVLYLADRRDTALNEVGATNSDVVLTEFRIRPECSARIAPIGELLSVQRTGRGYLAGSDVAMLNGLINACDQDEARSMLIVDAFLFSCLTNTDDDYELSSSVALAVFNKLPEVSAVAFPSRRQYGAVNFAIRQETVWRDWGIVSVRAGHAQHLAMGYFDLSDIRHVTGITHAGGLVWSVETSQEDSVLLLDPPWFSLDMAVDGSL